jgi:uroporphyrinogen-III C-methyltransferase
VNDSVRVLRRPVTVVPTYLLQDRSLTYQALVVYVVLLAFPDGVGDPVELVGRGLAEAEIEEALGELLDRGLIERRQV